uniref:Molybdopterin biosynthesis protein n=1 Tax=Sphondylothamnion multifidum TaxID=193186 RepID=A0A4D6WZ08_9FLOR|nr:Molybdopterin biosynthesis protein [Sphondylothamnion multifidum]
MSKFASYTSTLSNQEYSTYARHLILSNVGINGQKKLKNLKVLIIGAGGLGSPAMLYLVTAGVGYIGIIENDTIDVSNLNRQILYNRTEIKKPKIYTAKQKLTKINPYCKIITHAYKLNKINASSIIKYYHIIIDCSDNFNTRYISNTICYQLHKIYIYGGIQKFEGQIAIFNYQNGIKYDDIYPRNLKLNNNNLCNENGLLGVITGTIGILQATETLKITLGIGYFADNHILIYNLLFSSFKKIQIYPSKNLLYNYLPKNETKYTHNHLIISNNQLDYIKDKQIKKTILIDIRDNIIFTNNKTNKKKVINIPWSYLHLHHTIQFLKEYHKEKVLVIYCNTVYRSLLISNIFKYYKIKHYILALS